MPDIVFVFPPEATESSFIYYLGAGYIRAYLKKHTIETAQFTTLKRMTVPDIVKGIMELTPKVVGFTCYDTNYALVRILAKVLKKTQSDITIVMGGPTATFSAETAMNHTPEIDISVKGEGEKTMLELAQKQFTDLDNIKGITFRSGDHLVSTPERQLISSGKKGAELDILPSPYLTGIIPPDGKAGVITSRGCVYHCTYCNFSAMFNHTIRYHSVDRVIDEFKLIAKNWNPLSKSELFIINDDTFTLNVDRAKEICQRIIDEDIDLPFFFETRADLCDKELVNLMAKAGIHQVSYGLESASLTVLKTIQKAPGKEKAFLNQVESAVKWSKSAGLKTSVSCMFGLPGEGISEAKETVDFVETLGVDEYAHNILFLCAGTTLFDTCKEYGMDVTHSPWYLPYFTKHPYDVKKAPYLDNAHIIGQMKGWEHVYWDLVSYNCARNTEYYHYMVLKEMPDNNVYPWLTKYGVVPLYVVDVTQNVTKERAVNHCETLIKNDVPVGSYCLVQNGSTDTNTIPCFIKISTRMDLHIPAPETPFNVYTGGDCLISLDSVKDVESLAQFLESHECNGIVTFSMNELGRSTIISGCKWRSTVCPALNGGILVLDGNTVLSCYTGGPIGNVGDDITNIREKAQKILKEKEETRRCHACPVYTECSRCLYPAPFSDAEFCTLKQKYPDISQLITVLEWARQFSPGDHDVIQFSTGAPLFYHGDLTPGQAPGIKDTVHLASVEGNPSAFFADTLEGFSLGSELAVILEGFQLGVDKKAVVKYLYKTTGATKKEAEKAISDAIAIFEKVGFLL
ncbi:MAG: radical SAM protein [Candidatus Methanofastidiosia archaeon]|jgi:radical SAM superfamily enzyme YgiQ (UPF0313 family)